MQVLQNCCSMITGSPLVWQEYNYNLRKSDEDRTFSIVLLQHSWTHYSMMKLLARRQNQPYNTRVLARKWQSLIRDNVYTQFPRPGLYKPVFLNLHKNHLLTPSLGPPKTYWSGIYHDVKQVTYVTFIHSHLITTGIRSGVLCIDISCIRYIWRGKPGDMKL